MQDKNKAYKTKMTIWLSFLIGGISSCLGIFFSFILVKFELFNAFEYFMSLPLVVQIICIGFYVVLWALLSFVLYKELN
ncbi:hypothetical protein [Campylobacter sp. MIT 97-5078]|uniref:hypothetical protein n=1 Tax=Campylobacter sp. MIT 97-5078 TaxID=1548153 RepID=UPI000512CF30|nr:hypothetical protein [Campylobacter sp. MIT 97-5078]KGI55303.1 hypothetical protein LR59_12650 [Campylobacter sp. MIT 97-5078]TQR25571.1 hypothetical protein DMB91_07140 [Campylobacter sp. MIT 97-5078]